MIAAASVHPLDLLRTRMALRVNDFNIYKTLIKSIYVNEGFLAFFKGIQPNLFGVFLYKGISFFFYENILRLIGENNWIRKSHTRQFTAGAIASITAQIMTYPFDVLKRRYMVVKDRNYQFAKQSF